MNNYPYNPYKYSSKQGQEYAPYQHPPYERDGVVPGSAAYQSLLSKVLTLLSFSLVTAGFGLLV